DSGGRMSFMPLTARKGSAMCDFFQRTANAARQGRARAGRRPLASSTGERSRAVALFDVVLDDALELARDALAAQGQGLFAVDEDRRGRCLAGSRQADADVGMLAFARTVDDAAHHCDLHALDAGIA